MRETERKPYLSLLLSLPLCESEAEIKRDDVKRELSVCVLCNSPEAAVVRLTQSHPLRLTEQEHLHGGYRVYIMEPVCLKEVDGCLGALISSFLFYLFGNLCGGQSILKSEQGILV